MLVVQEALRQVFGEVGGGGGRAEQDPVPFLGGPGRSCTHRMRDDCVPKTVETPEAARGPRTLSEGLQER